MDCDTRIYFTHGNQDCMCQWLSGAKLNPVKREHQLVLLYAAVRGNPECIQALLERGMDVEGQKVQDNLEDQPALTWTAKYGSEDCQKIVQKYSPGLNMSSLLIYHALYFAAEGNHIKCVKTLMHFIDTADLDFEPRLYIDPLCVASEKDHLEIVTLLLRKEVNVNSCYGWPLREAVKSGKLTCAHVLLDYGANMAPPGTETILTTAIKKARCDIVLELLERGADPNQKCKLASTRYPIDILIKRLVQGEQFKKVDLKILELILVYGATLDLCQLSSETRRLFYDKLCANIELINVAITLSCPTCAKSIFKNSNERFKNNHALKEQITVVYAKSLSLKNQAIKCMRKYLNSCGMYSGKNFMRKVHVLPLPGEIKNSILCTDVCRVLPPH